MRIMNKLEILQQIEVKLKERIEQDKEDKKLKLISKILEEENWYLKIELNMFLDILMTLDFSKEEALNTYKELLRI